VREDINLLKIGILLLFLLSTAHATVWYVHPDSTLNRIETALGYCADNDTVLVGPGVYHEDIFWPNTHGICLLSEYGPDTTVIDADSTDNVICLFPNGDSTTVIKGFTIRNGYSWFHGGGINCQQTSPVIMNNIIINNIADARGGGIYFNGSSPIIRNNIIQNNTAGDWGGGIACLNSSTAVIADNIIISNNSNGLGGGVFCTESSPIITNNTLKLNTAAFAGGGITCWLSSPAIRGNTITRNIVGERGGGIYCGWSSPVVDSCTITSNVGDGIYCEFSSDPIINYNHIVDNTGYGVLNIDSAVMVNAEYNWWGDLSGPGGVGPGTGDEVSDYVDYDPWLTEPGVEENIVTPVKHSNIGATILSGPLQL
jgi:parallel beta-helix repeat protein